MKQVLSMCALLIIAGMMFVGCDQDLNSADGPEIRPMAAKSRSTPNPAWVFSLTAANKGKTYPSIHVCDVDGSDASVVYISSVTTNRTLFSTWSPNGGSVSFVDMPNIISNGWYAGTVYGDYAIKAVDVAVTSSGVSASNTRTIFSVTSADQMKIVSQAWCPATTGSGAGKIAFMAYTPTESRIYTVPVTGGTPTLIYSTTNTEKLLHGNSLTWSNDGTKLAFDEMSGTNTAAADVRHDLKIIDLSGSVVSTPLQGVKSLNCLQWSNAGLDQITYIATEVDPPTNEWNAYIIGTATGSTPTKVLTGVGNSYGIFWSPDNTQLNYKYLDGKSYIYTIATGVSTAVTTIPNGDWK